MAIDINKIILEIKEHLLCEEDAGLDWINVQKDTLVPLVFRSLESAARGCQRCGLSNTRENVVFGEGDPKARLMFVGEAPGVEEDSTGRPFIGRAGELLTKIIQAITLTREEVYITSVVKCHPPDNRTPSKEEIDFCKPFLFYQIKLIAPAIICTLGTIASQTILETNEPISKLRGRFHHYSGIRVMPTFHPAYLLRNPQAKKLVWEDMQNIQGLYDKIRA